MNTNPCEHCKGTGHQDTEIQGAKSRYQPFCPMCHGSGESPIQQEKHTHIVIGYSHDCPRCNPESDPDADTAALSPQLELRSAASDDAILVLEPTQSIIQVREAIRRELRKWDRVELDLENGGVADFFPEPLLLEELPKAIEALISHRVNEGKIEELEKFIANIYHNAATYENPARVWVDWDDIVRLAANCTTELERKD